MADIMRMGKNPNYLGSWDLEEMPNQEVMLTISKIVDEKVVANGQSQLCTVCHWTDKAWKPMILNVTNKKMICRLYKTKDTDKLIGKPVVIGVETVNAFGGEHDVLRIQKKIPKVGQAVKCADCGGDIIGAAGKGADYIVQGTKKTYGVALCWACACKRKEAAQPKEVKPDGTDAEA